MPELINTTTMPGDNMDPDSIDAAAKGIRGVGSSVSKQGGVVQTDWQKLSGSYHAPEQETLFAAMDPVKASAEQFGTDTGTVATALETFAEEVRTIKKAVAAIRTAAAALHASVGSDGKVQPAGGYQPYGSGYQLPVKWDQDSTTVDQNNRLRHQTADQLEALWAAERKCANAINAISCTAPIGPITESSNGKGYGYDDIPDDAQMPWGDRVTRDESCAEKVISDGIVIDGLGGMGNGIIGLFGGHVTVDDGGMHWDQSAATAGNAWSGLLKVVVGGVTFGPLGFGVAQVLPGSVGKYVRDSQFSFAATVSSLVAIDLYAKDPLHKWKENPWRAGGESLFNIGTFFVSELKIGNAAKAGEATRAGKVLSGAAKLTDPVYLAQRAARIGADALKTMKGPTLDVLNKLFKHSDLDEAVKLGSKVDLDLPSLPNHGPGTDHTNVGGGHHSDAPPARDYSGAGDHPGTGQHPGHGGTPTDGHPATPGHDGSHPTTDHPNHGDQQPPSSDGNQHAGDGAHDHSGDGHAVKGHTDPHVISDANSTAYHHDVADRKQLQTDHTKVLRERNDVARQLGVSKSDLKVANLQRTLDRLEDTADPADVSRLERLSRSEQLLARDLNRASEEMGMDASRDVITSHGGEVIVGAEKVAGKPHELDVVGVSHDHKTLTVLEGKGGDSPRLGKRIVDGVKVDQGSTAYLNDLLHRDPRVQAYLAEHPQFARDLASGKVDVEYKVVNARTNGRVRVTDLVVDPHGLHLGDLAPAGRAHGVPLLPLLEATESPDVVHPGR